MAETRSTVFGLPRYSADSDETMTRGDWEEAATNIEARAAYDDGGAAAAWPTTLLKAGRYAKLTYSDGYVIGRYTGTAWDEVGGSVLTGRRRMRGSAVADVLLSSDTGDGANPSATWTAGGEIGTSGLVRSVAGLIAGAPLNFDASAPSSTGRAYVGAGNGERGLVVQARHASSSNLFTARTLGGSDPTTIDALGRLRSSVPAAFGNTAPVTNIPLRSAPSATDLTALDLFARVATTGPTVPALPALRVYRDLADADTGVPILSVLPDAITLGRSGWTGSTITLRAAALNLVGPVDTGALTADSVASDAGLTGVGSLSVENAQVTSYNLGGSPALAGMRGSVPVANGSTSARDLRQSLAHRVRITSINATIASTVSTAMLTFEFTPKTDCHIDIALVYFLRPAGVGSSGQPVEPCNIAAKYIILDDSDNTIFTSDEIYELTVGAFTSWNRLGKGQLIINDQPPGQLTAGQTYRLRLFARRSDSSAISLVLNHVTGVLRECAEVSTIGTSVSNT